MPARLGKYKAREGVQENLQSIILSCHAIQAETEMLLYSENNFVYTWAEDWPKWGHLLGDDKRAAVKTIEIHRN
jgi:hypothetical protein